MMRMAAGCLIAAISSAAAAETSSKPNPYLAQAKVFHQGLQFEKCLKRLGQAPNWQSSVLEQAEVELYLGLCHFGLGHVADAEEHWAMALRVERSVALPPMQSPKVQALFNKVKSDMPAAVEVEADVEPAPSAVAPKAVELIPAPIEQPPAVTAEPVREVRWVVPALLGAGAAAGLVLGLVQGVAAKSSETQANTAVFADDAARLGAQAQTHATVSTVAFSVGSALAVGAVLTAVLLNLSP